MTVRRRARRGPLRTFREAGFNFSPVEANLDRVHIRFRDYFVYARDPNQLDAFLTTFAETTAFRRGGGNRSRWFDLSGFWLFGCNIRFLNGRGVFPEDGGAILPRLELTVDLELNLTRFCAHHGADYSRAASLDLHPALHRPPASGAIREVTTLDGNDNALSENQLTTIGDWQRWFGLYLSLVREFVDGAIQSACDPAANQWLWDADWDRIAVPNWQSAVVTWAEVYFERSNENALAAVYDLAPRLAELSDALTSTEYNPEIEPGAPQEAARGNALSLSVSLREQRTSGRRLDLVVYAKCFDRLRFEIRYIGNLAQLLGHGAIGAEDEDDEDWPSRLRTYLEQAVRDASGRLRHIHNALGPTVISCPPTVTDITIVAQTLMTACENDPTLFARLVALLVARGGVTGQLDPDMTVVLDRLTNEGVLVRRSVRQRNNQALPRFVLAPQYQRVRRALDRAMRGR